MSLKKKLREKMEGLEVNESFNRSGFINEYYGKGATSDKLKLRSFAATLYKVHRALKEQGFVFSTGFNNEIRRIK